MVDQEAFQNLQEILVSSNPMADIPEGLHSELVYTGALLKLALDGSDKAVSIITEASERCPSDAIRSLAYAFLADLGSKGNHRAVDALFAAFFFTRSDTIAAIIDQNKFQALSVESQAGYLLLSGKANQLRSVDPDYLHISAFFKASTFETQEWLLKTAHKYGLDHWALIVSAIRSDEEEGYETAVEYYSRFTAPEKNLLLAELHEKSDLGSSAAIDMICSIFILYDDTDALRITRDMGLAPNQSVNRALYYYLSGQWEQYETFDFNHALLATAFESASSDLRRRLLARSRFTGQNEWLMNLPGVLRTRWLGDMEDIDWEHAVQHLVSARKWDDIWRLSLVAPPLWAAQMIIELDRVQWQPAKEDEASFLLAVGPLARACAEDIIKLTPLKAIKNPDGSVLSLAVHPNGRKLAIGSMTNNIQFIPLPDGSPMGEVASSPAPTTRALMYDQSGEFLAVASGDNQIRIFRTEEGKVVKAISGHTNIVRSITLHPDQRSLFSCSFDGSIRACRFPQGTDLGKVYQSNMEMHAVAVSSDGTMILGSGADRTIRVWSWPDRQILREMQGHTSVVTLLAVSTSSPYLASYGADRTIRIWNFSSGKLLREISDLKDFILTSLLFLPNDQLLVTGDDKGNIWLISSSTGKILSSNKEKSHTHRITSLVHIPETNRLISGSADGTIIIWPLDTVHILRTSLSKMKTETIPMIQNRMAGTAITKNEHCWLQFILEMLKWRQRFDVELGEISTISAGEFDIEL